MGCADLADFTSSRRLPSRPPWRQRRRGGGCAGRGCRWRSARACASRTVAQVRTDRRLTTSRVHVIVDARVGRPRGLIGRRVLAGRGKGRPVRRHARVKQRAAQLHVVVLVDAGCGQHAVHVLVALRRGHDRDVGGPRRALDVRVLAAAVALAGSARARVVPAGVTVARAGVVPVTSTAAVTRAVVAAVTVAVARTTTAAGAPPRQLPRQQRGRAHLLLLLLLRSPRHLPPHLTRQVFESESRRRMCLLVPLTRES